VYLDFEQLEKSGEWQWDARQMAFVPSTGWIGDAAGAADAGQEELPWMGLQEMAAGIGREF
jgi:hypothetical protein